jgi:hypothetical protein
LRLLENLGPPGFALDRVLALLAPADQLSGGVQELPRPIARLTRVDGGVCSNLLARLVAIDYLHSESGLELGAMGADLAHWWWSPFQGRYTATEGNDGACPEKPDHLKQSISNAVDKRYNAAKRDLYFNEGKEHRLLVISVNRHCGLFACNPLFNGYSVLKAGFSFFQHVRSFC